MLKLGHMVLFQVHKRINPIPIFCIQQNNKILPRTTASGDPCWFSPSKYYIFTWWPSLKTSLCKVVVIVFCGFELCIDD